MSDSAQQAETGILVFGATGKALYVNAVARRVLGTTPPQALLAALPAQGAGIIRLASQCFRLSRMPWAMASLLRRFAMQEAAGDSIDGAQADEGPAERWSAATRQRVGAIIVVVEPLRQRLDLLRRLAHYGLSPRQCEVAVWARRGLVNGEIARQISIAEQTVKDHFQEIYCRVPIK